MKQRIVINVPMSEEESRKKAMKIASVMKGVSKVEVVKERNHLVVVGEGIDSVKLAKKLRKKFCFANIITIHNNNATVEEETTTTPRIRYDQPAYYMAAPFYDPNPPTSCSIF